MREKLAIRPDETAGELHDELMLLGNSMVVETIKKIEANEVQPITQEVLAAGTVLKDAPKIFKDFCYIQWNRNSKAIYNLIRGLSPYPAAHVKLQAEKGEELELKIYSSEIETCQPSETPGTVVTDNKTYLKIAANDGYILLTMIQQAGKKAMETKAFLRGFHFEGSWKA